MTVLGPVPGPMPMLAVLTPEALLAEEEQEREGELVVMAAVGVVLLLSLLPLVVVLRQPHRPPATPDLHLSRTTMRKLLRVQVLPAPITRQLLPLLPLLLIIRT